MEKCAVLPYGQFSGYDTTCFLVISAMFAPTPVSSYELKPAAARPGEMTVHDLRGSAETIFL